MPDDRTPVYLVHYNHFDPTWRRCWGRRFDYNGDTYASYADIEQAVIDDWIALAEKSPIAIVLEQTVSLRKYLERRPEMRDRIKALADEGRFELLASGEVIPDANMPQGESLVRNMLYGILWAEQEVGLKVTTGCRCDGFGSSAQLPQIFRRSEVDWLPFFSYTEPDNDYWRGLDGTTLYVRPPWLRLIQGGTHKLKPCEVCHGKGCDQCAQRGFDQSYRVEVNNWLHEIEDEPLGVIQLGGEETLPNMNIQEEMQAEQARRKDVAFKHATFDTIAADFAQDIQRVDEPAPERITRNPDIAGSSAGCWVTRIKLKQRNRRSEHELMQAETLAALAWIRNGKYAQEELTEAWRDLIFTHFHDALPATHIDPACDELMDMYDAIDATARKVAVDASKALFEKAKPAKDARSVSVINTLSWKRSAPVTIELEDWSAEHAHATDAKGELPVYRVEATSHGKTQITLLAREIDGMGVSQIEIAPAPKPRVERSQNRIITNDRFEVSADGHGVTSIRDRQLDREWVHPAFHHCGELILEHDYGDPWATRKADHFRERMSPFGRFKESVVTPTTQELVFEGTHPGNFHDFEVNWLSWTQRVVLHKDLPTIEFFFDVDWDTHNRRLRVAFPTTVHNDTGHYEIPYGTLERQRYNTFTYHPNGINGDWPAIHWAAPASKTGSVAVINRGEGSTRIEGGNVFVSLLRSPTTPWCLYEPNYYRMPLFDGMRDSAMHHFRIALYPYEGSWQDTDVTQMAWSYNRPMHATVDTQPDAGMPALQLDADGTMISTVKRAETSESLVVRLYEFKGRSETVALRVPESFTRAEQVNLLERRPSTLKIEGGVVRLKMEPYMIETVKLGK